MRIEFRACRHLSGLYAAGGIPTGQVVSKSLQGLQHANEIAARRAAMAERNSASVGERPAVRRLQRAAAEGVNGLALRIPLDRSDVHRGGAEAG
jgi:hypothetical protein